MKKTLRIIAFVMVFALSVALFASCGGGDNASQPAENNEAATTAQDTSAEDTVSETSDYVDYNNVALSITEYSEMEKFLKDFQNGAMDGKVVEIIGVNSKLMSSCSIDIKDDKISIGCTWKLIEGEFPDAYPEDGAKIRIKGVVKVADEYGSRAVMVPAENLEILE